ncbi:MULTISPECIES: DUF7556 family protein [Halorussus]|uniref:DUF7556 family protein n=1 Tax=Halorussus TaxID=1070314 RepID=UPI00209CE177|nr:hypothetical protein [Halorussus vallis]USZ74138.1 hypothetical protein NGM07_11820 [Halorussus vallis]
MVPDTATALDAVLADGNVMASVDDDGRTERLIIADTTADDAWLSVPTAGSTSLAEWR